MRRWLDVVRKSIGAAVLIGLGDYALLKMGNPLGPVIFAFGLLGVCYLGQNLFTGKCGFMVADRIKILDLITILIVNLATGYLMGVIFAAIDGGVSEAALAKVESWDFSVAFLVKSLLCGIIMYLAVAMYRKGTPLGIIFGVPLFIFCGFQHCIANVITMGAAVSFSWTIVLAIVGNLCGSLFMWVISAESLSKST